jgi:hypothetical protein
MFGCAAFAADALRKAAGSQEECQNQVFHEETSMVEQNQCRRAGQFSAI